MMTYNNEYMMITLGLNIKQAFIKATYCSDTSSWLESLCVLSLA